MVMHYCEQLIRARKRLIHDMMTNHERLWLISNAAVNVADIG